MTAAELTAAGIPVEDNAIALLRAEAALDWMIEHTTLNINKSELDTISALPASAKLFAFEFCNLVSKQQGVASQSIEGLSMSFHQTSQTALIWELANTHLKAYLKSQVKFLPAKRRW